MVTIVCFFLKSIQSCGSGLRAVKQGIEGEKATDALAKLYSRDLKNKMIKMLFENELVQENI